MGGRRPEPGLAAGDPSPGENYLGVLTLEQLAQQLVNGVLIGLVYSLLAIGLTLIWGVMNVLNFAHGDFLMIGMFLSYWLYALAGVDPLFSIPINAVALFLLGMFIYRFIAPPFFRGETLNKDTPILVPEN